VETYLVLSWLAVEELEYSGAEVARYLGDTTSCATRAVSSGRAPERENYFVTVHGVLEAHPPVNIVHFASKSVGAGEKTRIGHKRAGGKGK